MVNLLASTFPFIVFQHLVSIRMMVKEPKKVHATRQNNKTAEVLTC